MGLASGSNDSAVAYAFSTAFDLLGLGRPQAAGPRTPVRVCYGNEGAPPSVAGQVSVRVPRLGDWAATARPPAGGASGFQWLGDGGILLSRDVAHDLWFHLTAGDDREPTRREPGARAAKSDEFVVRASAEAGVAEMGAAISAAFGRLGLPMVSLAPWPQGRPFALLLSHDVDQIYDRELWRVLADLNHLQKVLRGRERGAAGEVFQRIVRAVARPKHALADFRRILELESRRGFRSTFFVLDDPYWSRYGARFRLGDRAVGDVVRLVRDAGCEVGYHGGYYSFNDPGKYARGRRRFTDLFGEEPRGIRNHYLRFSYPETWRAQAEAGFRYDSTLGYRHLPGFRAGVTHPFMTYDREREESLDLVELPLAVMDTSLFRYLALTEGEAVAAASATVDEARRYGGLVTLLWHNNFFNEPEYRDWEGAYVRLLDELYGSAPYCATGGEISRWWRDRRDVVVDAVEHRIGWWRGRLRTPRRVADIALRVQGKIGAIRAEVNGKEAQLSETPDAVNVHVPVVEPGAGTDVVVTIAVEA